MKKIILYELRSMGEAVLDEKTKIATLIDIFNPETHGTSYRTRQIGEEGFHICTTSLGRLSQQEKQEIEDKELTDYLKSDSITTKDGLLYLNGIPLGVDEADDLAHRWGFDYAENLVRWIIKWRALK